MMCATLNMSTVENGTVGVSCTGPASGYKLKPSRLFVVFVLFLYRLNTITNNIYAAIILLILNNSIIFLLDFGIKIYCKMSKHLTGCPITVDANPLSVSTTSHASPPPPSNSTLRTWTRSDSETDRRGGVRSCWWTQPAGQGSLGLAPRDRVIGRVYFPIIFTFKHPVNLGRFLFTRRWNQTASGSVERLLGLVLEHGPSAFSLAACDAIRRKRGRTACFSLGLEVCFWACPGLGLG
jgi:hypothetical protein